MERLIILSDMWGNIKMDWITKYTSILNKYFEIEIYDCCELGEIILKDFSEEKIHNQFINGGIERAVYNLIKKESDYTNVLGFSIGGTIGWKAASKGLKVLNFTAISATRLRKESVQPNCKIDLFFAENDNYIPKNEWFSDLKLNKNIYKNENHNFYTKKAIAIEISKLITNKYH
jgi:hypothetical protein